MIELDWFLPTGGDASDVFPDGPEAHQRRLDGRGKRSSRRCGRRSDGSPGLWASPDKSPVRDTGLTTLAAHEALLPPNEASEDGR